MSLSTYANAAYNIGEELRALLLQHAAFEPLLASLSSETPHHLTTFLKENLDLVERIVSATPAKRQNILGGLSLETQFWAIAAAAQMAFEAYAVLKRADTEFQPLGAYRNKILAVQDVLAAPYDDPNYNWPFPSSPPFEMD